MKIILTLCLLFFSSQGLFAFTSKIQVKSREVQRLHSDSDTIGSQVYLNSADLQLNETFGNWFIEGTQTQESYLMRHPDGTEYVNLDIQKSQPKVKYKAENLTLSASVVIYQPSNNPKLYEEFEAGKKDQLNLHAVSGAYQLGAFGLEAATWQETEVFGLNWHFFTTFVYQTDQVGLSWESTTDQKLTVKQAQINRVWPADYDLNKSQTLVSYKFQAPSLFGASWNGSELKGQRTTLLGQDQDEYSLRNDLHFEIFGAKHFLAHSLTFVNTITTYKEGDYQYSLIEEYQSQSDIVQTIDYTAFTAIKESGFFVSWGYQIKDSLQEQTLLDQQIQLALSYAWK